MIELSSADDLRLEVRHLDRKLAEAVQELEELEQRWLGMRDCYDREVLRVGKAEQQVKKLQEGIVDVAQNLAELTVNEAVAALRSLAAVPVEEETATSGRAPRAR